MVNIRLAEPNDLQQVQQLNRLLFQHELSRDPSLDSHWPMSEVGRDYFETAINAQGQEHLCLVAVHDDKIIGYLAASIEASDTTRHGKSAELENTFILEEWRGQGVGSKLFDYFYTWAKEQGATRLKVEAYAANADAIAFYKRHGFTDWGITLEQEIL